MTVNGGRIRFGPGAMRGPENTSGERTSIPGAPLERMHPWERKQTDGYRETGIWQDQKTTAGTAVEKRIAGAGIVPEVREATEPAENEDEVLTEEHSDHIVAKADADSEENSEMPKTAEDIETGIPSEARKEKNKANHTGNKEDQSEEEVDLNGFQVVRREFFAHTREPSIMFNDGKIGVNAACVRKLPDVDYVQILIHREKQLLAIKPCAELDLFSFQWGKTIKGKRVPRTVTGKLFHMKVCDMMGWNPNYRYKILGRLCRSNGDNLFVFDLKSAETYEKTVSEKGGKKQTSRVPVLPMEWKDQFGIPFEEQHKALQVNMFDGFTLFSLKEKPQKEHNGDANPDDANTALEKGKTDGIE